MNEMPLLNESPPIIGNPNSQIPNPKSVWRKRVGVEPTQACSHTLTDGFEDRARHRTGCASAVKSSVIKTKVCESFLSSVFWTAGATGLLDREISRVLFFLF